MKNLTEYLYPSDLNQALALLSEEKNSEFIAGGTAGVRDNVKRLVDIMQLGLNEILESGSAITIGSTSTITGVYKSTLVEKIGDGVLKKACQLCADTPLRNGLSGMGTGNSYIMVLIMTSSITWQMILWK